MALPDLLRGVRFAGAVGLQGDVECRVDQHISKDHADETPMSRDTVDNLVEEEVKPEREDHDTR